MNIERFGVVEEEGKEGLESSNWGELINKVIVGVVEEAVDWQKGRVEAVGRPRHGQQRPSREKRQIRRQPFPLSRSFSSRMEEVVCSKGEKGEERKKREDWCRFWSHLLSSWVDNSNAEKLKQSAQEVKEDLATITGEEWRLVIDLWEARWKLVNRGGDEAEVFLVTKRVTDAVLEKPILERLFPAITRFFNPKNHNQKI